MAAEIDQFVCNKELFINREKLSELMKKYPRNIVMDTIVEYIRTEKISFPWKRLFININAFNNFRKLSTYTPVISHKKYFIRNLRLNEINKLRIHYNFNNAPYLIMHAESEYLAFDILSDMFAEEMRMAANVKNSVAPITYWKNSARYIVNDVVDSVLGGKYIALNTEVFRETIYHQVKECNSFKPTIVVAIINALRKTFGAEINSYLDISAGWGDRLIGALAADIKKYTGYDPNTALKPAHDQMIKTFARVDQEVNIVYEPFETAKIPPNSYDVVLSSPPYFDYEVYSDGPAQSIKRHNTLASWVNNFLMPSILLAVASLRPGGFLCMHLSDIRDADLCNEAFAAIFNANCKYIGLISSAGGSGNPRPIWIFRKN